MQTQSPYQPLAPLLLAAIGGILCDRLFALPALFWIFLALTALGILCFHRQNALLFVACAALFGFWHHQHWFRFADNDIGHYADLQEEPAALIGTLKQMPRFYPKPPAFPGQIFDPSERTMFTLQAEQLRDGNDWIPVRGNVLITVYDDCRNLRIGDRIQLFGILATPSKPNNPGDFDYNDYLRGHRTLAQLRVPDSSAIELLDSGRWTFSRGMESIRRTGLANLNLHLSEQTRPIAEAMIFGVRESVDEGVRQSMLDTGTLHLLAISGLHVTLIAGIAAWFLRLLNFSRKTTAVTLIVFVLFYLMLTDVRTPAIRAVALTCSAAVALYVIRPVSAKNVFCASALVVLLVRPSELFQFGAQLSFIAVASCFWLPRYARLKAMVYKPYPDDADTRSLHDTQWAEYGGWRWLRRAMKLFRLSVEVFLISFTIWLFSMPILLSQINLFTPIAVIVNPLTALPLTAAMSCGFLTAMLGQIPWLGSMFGFGADWSFWILLELIAWFQDLGGHYWVPGPPGWWVLGFYAVFAFFTFLPIHRPYWLAMLAVLLVWILIGLGAGYYRDYERLRDDRLTLTVLSVGHGNCVLITTPDKRTIICDAGNLTTPRYAADAMSKSLWRLGKTHIDAILISHPDNDHFSAVPFLLDRFSVGVVLISPYFPQVHEEEILSPWSLLRAKIEERQIPIRVIGQGDDLAEWGLADSIILHPPKEDFWESHNTNAASLVLRFEHRGEGILLPGDLDGREPSPFLLREPIPTQIVMVPHHGGRSMQTEALLEWSQAKTLLFSTGRLTHNLEMLDRRREQGYEVRCTFCEGAIVFEIGRH